MNAATAPTATSALPQTPASDVKKLGWRGVMRLVAKNGTVLVTNHNQPEAVILPVDEYNRILQLLIDAGERDRIALEVLRKQYEARFDAPQTPETREKLRALLRSPLKLDGHIIAGEGF